MYAGLQMDEFPLQSTTLPEVNLHPLDLNF
jgi:hypothetical protein